MSLTQAETVFASIHENALNDVLTAFCTARPHHLFYGSPAFTPVTTVSETRMDAIPFPGIPGGIQWRLRMSIPAIDLFKQTRNLPPELTMGPGQFSAAIDVELCIECRKIKIDPKPPQPDKAQPDKRRDEKPINPDRDTRHPLAELTCFKLQVFALGHLEHVAALNGEDGVAFGVDAVEIVDVRPGGLESFLECLLFLILQSVLANIRLPLRALRAGAFQLIPTVGPLIEEDQIKMRGTV